MFFKVAVITTMATQSSLCALLNSVHWRSNSELHCPGLYLGRPMAGYATDQERTLTFVYSYLRITCKGFLQLWHYLYIHGSRRPVHSYRNTICNMLGKRNQHQCSNQSLIASLQYSSFLIQNIQWNPSIADTSGNQHFVPYSEVSLAWASGIFPVSVVCVIGLLSTMWLCFLSFLLLYAGGKG